MGNHAHSTVNVYGMSSVGLPPKLHLSHSRPNVCQHTYVFRRFSAKRALLSVSTSRFASPRVTSVGISPKHYLFQFRPEIYPLRGLLSPVFFLPVFRCKKQNFRFRSEFFWLPVCFPSGFRQNLQVPFVFVSCRWFI